MKALETLVGAGVARASSSPQIRRSARTAVRRRLPSRVMEAVWRRDCYVCRWCGFQSDQFQEVILLDGTGHDIDQMVTACIFCHQAYHLDLVPEMRSGVLVWLPEFDQVELNQIAREIYILRASIAPGAKEAAAALDRIMGTADLVKERLGSGGLEDLLSILSQGDVLNDPDLAERLSGIRLMPRDRRILMEGDRDYNQFPAILAHWRATFRAGSIIDALARMDGFPPAITSARMRLLTMLRRAMMKVGPDVMNAKEHEQIGDSLWHTPWVTVDDYTRATVLDFPTPIDGLLELDPNQVRIVETTLPWYPQGTRLIRITDDGWPVERLAIYYILSRDRVYRLMGSAQPIHEVNVVAPIRLSEDNILDYLRFFGFFVRAEEGPFYVAESIDDPFLPTELDRPTRTTLEEKLRSAIHNGRDPTGNYLCEAVIFYSDTLFRASFSIEPGGSIEMSGDEPLAAGLPVRIRAPIKYEGPGAPT